MLGGEVGLRTGEAGVLLVEDGSRISEHAAAGCGGLTRLCVGFAFFARRFLPRLQTQLHRLHAVFPHFLLLFF